MIYENIIIACKTAARISKYVLRNIYCKYVNELTTQISS